MRVAVIITTATHEKSVTTRVFCTWVAEVAVLQTSQPKKGLLGSKVWIWIQGLFSVGMNTTAAATSATYAVQSLVFTGFSWVAVPENAATRGATLCYLISHKF